MTSRRVFGVPSAGWAWVLLVASVLVPDAVWAQHRVVRFPARFNTAAAAPPTPAAAADTSTAGTVRLTLAGLALGAAGAWLGYQAGRHGTDSLEGGLVAAALAESVLLPVGVHAANERRGWLSGGVAASVGLGVLGLAYCFSQYTDQSVVMASVAVPVLQAIAAVNIERNSASRAGPRR